MAKYNKPYSDEDDLAVSSDIEKSLFCKFSAAVAVTTGCGSAFVFFAAESMPVAKTVSATVSSLSFGGAWFFSLCSNNLDHAVSEHMLSRTIVNLSADFFEKEGKHADPTIINDYTDVEYKVVNKDRSL